MDPTRRSRPPAQEDRPATNTADLSLSHPSDNEAQPTPTYGAMVGAWFELIRRSRLRHRFKLAALVVGSYADADGTGIHCGTARLALDAQCGYSTARRYLGELRRIGLIERIRRVRQARHSDEYRLILGPDVLEHLDVPDPERYRQLAAELRATERRGRTAQSMRAVPDNSRTARIAERYGDSYRSKRDSVPLALGEHPPTPSTPTREKPTSHDEMADLRTDVAVGRANQDQISSDGLIDATPSAGGCTPSCANGYRLDGNQHVRCDCAESAA